MSSVQLGIRRLFEVPCIRKKSVISLLTKQRNNLDVQYVFTPKLGSIIIN